MNLMNQIFICDFFYCHRMTRMKQTSIWLNLVNLVTKLIRVIRVIR